MFSLAVVVDDDVDLRLGRHVVVGARPLAVDHRKVGALLKSISGEVFHLDIEQVDKRAVLLVADVSLVKDPGGKRFCIGLFCDLGKRHGRRDRIRVRVLVGDDPQRPLPAGEQGEEPLRDPACVLFFHLEDRLPCNHFLRVEDKIRPGRGQFLAVHRVGRAGNNLHTGIAFPDGKDCREVCIAITGHDKRDLEQRKSCEQVR